MIVDIAVIAVLLASALISFLRGFIREALTIAGMLGGTLAAYFGGPMLAPQMRLWLGMSEGAEPEKLLGVVPVGLAADFLAYGSIFIVVVIVLSVISHFVSEGARAIGLGSVDRTLGVIFGLARGVVLLSLVYLPFYVLMGKDSKESWFKESKTIFYLDQTSAVMAGLLPQETMKMLESNAGKVASKDGDEQSRPIDLLKGGSVDTILNAAKNAAGGPGTPPAQQQSAPSPQQQQGAGYTEEFRQDMDKLFEDKTRPAGGESKQ